MPPFRSLSRRTAALAAVAGAIVSAALVGGSAQALRASSSPLDVTLVDQPFNCTNYPQPLNLGTVKVTITANAPAGTDAVKLPGPHGDCSGTIQRLQVETWLADGVKVGPGAHDLTIGGGYIFTHAHGVGAHQDGIQAMGGTNVTFNHLLIYAPTSNNAGIYLNGGADGTVPTNVVCDGCTILSGNKPYDIGHAVGSGVENSVVFNGLRAPTVNSDPTVAVNPVDVNNLYPGYCLTPQTPGNEGKWCPTANPSVVPAVDPGN